MTILGDDLATALELVRADSTVAGPSFRERVADAIYGTVHCRLPRRQPAAPGILHPAGSRDFVDRLSAANAGNGTWQDGWIVREIEPDGGVVAEHQGVLFWVPSAEFQPENGGVTVGGSGFVRIPKEQFQMASGFYCALGDARPSPGSARAVRVYWHITSSGAEPLVRWLTQQLNRCEIAFQMKVLSDPSDYHRTDSAVLYLARDDYPRALPVLRNIRAAMDPWVRPTVSLLVKRLASGVGLGEEPTDGSSFGEHRSRLLAGILADAEWGLLGSRAERVAFLSCRLARDGYELDRMYLSPGSEDDFPPLEGP
jgi:hypothetical protein